LGIPFFEIEWEPCIKITHKQILKLSNKSEKQKKIFEKQKFTKKNKKIKKKTKKITGWLQILFCRVLLSMLLLVF